MSVAAPATDPESSTSRANEDESEATAPSLVCRWLHGGPALDDLTSIPLSSTSATKDAPPSVWRSFTDGENERLESSWQQLDDDAREHAWRTKLNASDLPKSGRSSAASSRRGSTVDKPGERPRKTEDDADVDSERAVHQDNDRQEADKQANEDALRDYIADPDEESKPHVVHVSQDNLFSANLLSLSLYPVFWKGARIGIQRGTWFYPSSSLRKFYPVDSLLAHHLEEAYHEIRPYDTSYADELRSAVEIGAEAETKLRHIMPEVGVDVIFQGPDSARLYARNLPARLSKSFLTSFIRDKGQHSGGTLVYRGYDTVMKNLAAAGKTPTKAAAGRTRTDTLKGKASSASLKQDAVPSDSDTDGKATEDFDAKDTKGASSQSRFANFFSLSYGKHTNNNSGMDAAEKGDDNTTAEAMEDSKGDNDGEAEPELAELVLIVHGIGQKLATTYESFNIVHAIIQLRKICNKQGKNPAISSVIGNKRLQFIPLQWRSSLQFDEMTEDDGDLDAELDNRFSINDIQVEGAIPFVRSIMTGVAMDLAFYLSHHRDRMTATVIRDANRIYRLFRLRNPNWNGKVSLVAHSLGTALACDILSKQPTLVPDLYDLSPDKQKSNDHFVFNVSTLFFLGSPVSYMFFLNRAQLIARKGRARTQNVPKTVALDKVGRYGCMAIDSLYNIYNVVDPVAACLNACVDAEYSKIIKPLPINSVTSSLVADYTAKVSSFLGSLIPTFGGGKHAAATKPKQSGVAAESDAEKKEGEARAHEELKIQRPKTKRQVTSELDSAGLRRFERAEARMLALNPQGSVDFYLTAEGFSQYYDMLLSHASYWSDVRFATFLLTQLLASSGDIKKSREKREEEEEQAAREEAGKPQG